MNRAFAGLNLIPLVALLLAAAGGPVFQRHAPAHAFTRAGIAPVTLTLTVRDKEGRYVAGLDKDQLSVADEKTPAEITHFEKGGPASVAFVFDLSKQRSSALLAEAGPLFLKLMAEGDSSSEYLILGFDATTHLTTDLTRDRGRIAAGLDELATAGPSKKTALYDALRLAIEKLGDAAGRRRVVLLLSDGEDDGSKMKRAELLDLVKQSDVLIYTVSADDQKPNFIDASDAATLNQLASITGGLAVYPRSSGEFEFLFGMLAEELRNQYSVSFIPPGSAKAGEWRRLSFKAKPLELKSPSSNGVKKMALSVRGREGYYVRES